ncbi:unnamed protein product [Dicrocoelium dendriticum]|nr:unnamed protein product [Dicrocoelium dendriticum]
MQLELIIDIVTQLEGIIKEKPVPQKPSLSGGNKAPRESGLLIPNAPESDKESSAEKILDDQTFFKRMVSILLGKVEQDINIVSASRLGRNQHNPSKTRSLNDVCQDEDECRRILRRTSRHKGETFLVLKGLSQEDRVRMR